MPKVAYPGRMTTPAPPVHQTRRQVYFRGAWGSGVFYYPGDLVSSSSHAYVCSHTVQGATAPGSDSDHWDELL